MDLAAFDLAMKGSINSRCFCVYLTVSGSCGQGRWSKEGRGRECRRQAVEGSPMSILPIAGGS